MKLHVHPAITLATAAVLSVSLASLAARAETPAAFGRRCIPAGRVAPPSNTTGILGRRALPPGRLAALGATPWFHHGLQEQATCARSWVGREAAIEEYLKTAKVVKMSTTDVGVTKPSKAILEPGGPVDAMAWKPLAPRMRNGFWESYKSEIAAYELDKLLELRMVPPKVERTLRAEVGVAVMWASPATSFRVHGRVPPPPPGQIPQWTRQLVRAKMFDNIIANVDPNLGNWLVDQCGHIILIDHSRAFTTTRRLVHKMDNVDGPLWERMKALDVAALAPALGKWLGKHEIAAILERRDRLGKAIDQLIATKGQSVIMR